jgi:hypothetical protein
MYGGNYGGYGGLGNNLEQQGLNEMNRGYQ